MSSPWGKNQNNTPVQTVSFAEIMSEEYAHQVQAEEEKRFKKLHNKADDFDEWEDYSGLLSSGESSENSPKKSEPSVPQTGDCKSDEEIARMLQSQFDHEYNEEIRRIEQKRNKSSKITVVLDKYKRHGDLEFLEDDDDDEDDDNDDQQRRDWDRFETNEKILDTIPKCGFRMDKEGEVITKHDEQLCGIRNACRVMSFPPEFSTGDGAGFDMKLSNSVFNQLKTYSLRGAGGSNKKNKAQNRRENMTTAEMGVDQRTRLLLYKLVNNQILEHISGIVSTGKEAVILHANSDPAFDGTDVNGQKITSILVAPHLLPKECAIKIFKTTLNDFKQRDRYIKDDYRFKDRMKKQSKGFIINLWAEKEMLNFRRMKSVGINCPDVVILKKHVLVMSFIGANNKAAPKLKDARLSDAELSVAYEEIIGIMYKLYNEAKLVHADFSEYNILWYDGKCWIIDVAQAVEPGHPSALEFLMRDCGNVVNFFTKRGLANIYTKEQLFEHITSFNSDTHNVAMLERIRSKGPSVAQATAPNQDDCPDALKPIAFPFETAWEQSKGAATVAEEQAAGVVVDDAVNCFNVLKITAPLKEESEEGELAEGNASTFSSSPLHIVNCETNTAEN